MELIKKCLEIICKCHVCLYPCEIGNQEWFFRFCNFCSYSECISCLLLDIFQMSYGADHLFYLAVDLTFVIICDRALTANCTVHNKYSKTIFRESVTVIWIWMTCVFIWDSPKQVKGKGNASHTNLQPNCTSLSWPIVLIFERLTRKWSNIHVVKWYEPFQ